MKAVIEKNMAVWRTKAVETAMAQTAATAHYMVMREEGVR